MHIPDGYLSPQTYAPAYGAMIALWAWASAKLKRTLRTRRVPMLALGAAFSFVIMMFNVPIPGGTSGHAVGSVLVAILLGPWAAMIAVSLALIVQAVVFCDGGITAIGANCLSMAVVMPFAGWWVYRLIAGAAPAGSRRHVFGAAVGGYVGINAAAFVIAVMFGIQPLIARDAMGHALYCPFPLQVAIPAMAVGHLLVFGFVEAAVTGLVVAHVQRTEPALLATEEKTTKGRPLAIRRLVMGLVVLTLLSPLGLYLPARFGGGPAWGEWSASEVTKLTGHTPSQLAKLSSLWCGPLPDYAPPGHEAASLPTLMLFYFVSAAVGISVIAAATIGLRKLLARRQPL